MCWRGGCEPTTWPGGRYFVEAAPYDPPSVYLACQGGSDHLVQGWHHTYPRPVLVTNCSNSYVPSKLIPPLFSKHLRARSCPSTAKARTCATGSISRTMFARSVGCSRPDVRARRTTSPAIRSGTGPTALCAGRALETDRSASCHRRALRGRVPRPHGRQHSQYSRSLAN